VHAGRVEWCGREWTSFNYSQHDVVLPIDQPNCITRTVIENVLRFWNFRRLIFMINDVAHCAELVALADGIGASERIVCVSRDDIIPGVYPSRLRACRERVCVCVCECECECVRVCDG
jgi:hypothetical protein